MNQYKQYILNELETIEKECREQGVSASKWIERHAEEYCKKYWNADTEKRCLFREKVKV